MEEAIDKGIEGENFVTDLSSNSYLKYWCYPNPVDLSGDKKEICDLLILFFDTAIIISVKNYDVGGNYERFKKRVVEKSSKQLFGAERKLFNSGRAIEISHPEKGNEVFNPAQYLNIFRITVSVGESFENYEFVDSKDGKGCVNIFNRETFEIISKELDTIKDLTEYLKAREQLLIKNIGVVCKCRERDLIAAYLLNNREFPGFLSADFNIGTTALRNKWTEYSNHRQVFLKKLADQNSYFIDHLIKTDVLKLENGELLAKELMTLSRFERRIIANNLYETVEKGKGIKDYLGRRFTKYNDIGFLFILYPKERPEAAIDWMLKKAQELYSYHHQSDTIILLAATEGLKQWKFSMFKAGPLTEDLEKYLIKLTKDFGWFTNEKRVERNIQEYPD